MTKDLISRWLQHCPHEGTHGHTSTPACCLIPNGSVFSRPESICRDWPKDLRGCTLSCTVPFETEVRETNIEMRN